MTITSLLPSLLGSRYALSSVTSPLWTRYGTFKITVVIFVNYQLIAQLKVGDDVRQDALVLQIVTIMNNLWRKDGLDLRMLVYKVLPTARDRGMPFD